MDPTAAYERRAELTFIDVRKAYEWEAGHVEGSVHITLQELPQRFAEVATDKPIVVVCQIGQRSALATDFLRAQGRDAHNLEGGVERWVREGLPLVSAERGPGEIVDGWAETLEW